MNNILTIYFDHTYHSIALCTAGNCYDIQIKQQQPLHTFLSTLEQFLRLANLTLPELTLIVYNAGPGSFINLRSGLNYACGLAYSRNIALATVSAFELFLLNPIISTTEYIVILIAAGNNKCFCAVLNSLTRQHYIQPAIIELAILESYIDNLQLSKQQVTITGNVSLADITQHHYCYIMQQSVCNAAQMLQCCLLGRFELTDIYQSKLHYIHNNIALTVSQQKS